MGGGGMETGNGRLLPGHRRIVAGGDRPRSRRWVRRAAAFFPRQPQRRERLMFRVMLYTQWKWSRLIILLGAIAAFALPIISLQGAARADRNPLAAQDLLRAVQSWGTLYPVLAAALGLLVAMAGWAPDHRGRHVHALTLPLPRWRYVLLRCACGALLLAIPAVAVLAGALLATATATLPPGLQSYPFALPAHFVLAPAGTYGGFFAFSPAPARPPRPLPPPLCA